ncbi:MAG: hypothetical protein MJ050_08890, partial [Phascolarctobacterium sp.]|nr:hypothetical protein [Phascolarctobacterium sp.]
MFIFDFIFGLATSAKNFIFYGGLIIAALLGFASLGDDFSSFTSQIYYGYPAADRKPTFTVGKYDENAYNWKLFGEAKDTGVKVFYDRNSVSLDDKNGIATVLMKVQRNKEINLYRIVLRYDTPQNEMLITDIWSNTNKLSKNFGIVKVEKDS